MNSARNSLASSLNGYHHPQGMDRGACRTLPRKIIINMNSNVELKTSTNAWKPCLKKLSPTVDPEAQKTQELLKNVCAILNKMTPEKFSRLMEQVHHLEITSEERLNRVVELIFEKAIAEPSFATIYARMCSHLATLTVPMKEDPNSSVRFSSLLVRRCRELFQEKENQLDSAASSTESRQAEEDLQKAQAKARKRSIGNIRFIGELFKQNMLAESVMLSCIKKLLNISDEESLECLCQLLSTIGLDIDTSKSKPQMDDYFSGIESLISNRTTSSRLRFLLQDLVDLRSNNWVSRRMDQRPKTIQDIHKEAQTEGLHHLKKVNRQGLFNTRERQLEKQREQRQREEREREVREREESMREQRRREEREREESMREQRQREEREREESMREQRQREEREREESMREQRQREEREHKKREREKREGEKRVRAFNERVERERDAFMRAEKVREAVERSQREGRVGVRVVIERVERENRVRQQRVTELREQRVREREESEQKEREKREREERERAAFIRAQRARPVVERTERVRRVRVRALIESVARENRVREDRERQKRVN